MAGRSRSVEFDLLVTGTETGGRKVERLGEKFDDLREKVERLDGTTARVKGIAKLEKDSDKLGATVAALAGQFLAAGKTVLKFASYAGLAAGAAAPLAVGLASATVAVSTFAAEASGAALALLPIAAGALLVQRTLVSAGPAMLQAIQPLTAEWEKQQVVVGKLTTQGIEPLAKAFARGNFHVIGRAQERIAEATNRTLIATLKWLNTTQAQKTLAAIGDNTAKSYERLLPAVQGVAKSVLLLAGRIAGVSFDTFTEAADKALNKLREWIDTLGRDDVARGFERIKQAADSVVTAFRAIGEAIAFVDRNKDKILQLSDAILVLTAVGAAFAGGWVVALGASLLLLARHWDDVKAAAEEVGTAFQNLPQRFTTLQGVIDSLDVAWASIKTGFREFVDDVGPTLQPTLDRLKDAFVKMQPAIAATVTILGALAKAFLEIAGPVVGGLITAFGLVADALSRVVLDATRAAGLMLSAFAAIFQPIASLAKKLKLPFADAFQSFVDGSRNAANRINSSMAQVKTDLARNEIERLQRRIAELRGKTVITTADRAEIERAKDRIASLQRSIGGLRSKTITVTTAFKAIGSPTSGFAGGGLLREKGGPVKAGRPYIVGEKRPEVFVPKSNGTIIPRVPTSFPRALGGGTTVINVTLNAPQYVGDKRDLVRALDDLRRSGRLPRAV